MNIRCYRISFVVAIIFALSNCFAGFLVVENNYEEIYVVRGNMTFREGLSVNIVGSTDTTTLLTYNPKNNLTASHVFVKLENFFGKKTGTIYRVSKTLKEKILEVYFKIDYTTCGYGDTCVFKKNNIQDFYCTVVEATFDGVELKKRSAASEL